MSEEISIRYEDDDIHIILFVKQATFADGLRRAALQRLAMPKPTVEGQDEQSVLDLLSGMDVYARQWVFPSCVCCTRVEVISGEFRIPTTYAEFERLPDALVDLWISAVWEKNPHFSPFGRSLSKAQSDSSTNDS